MIESITRALRDVLSKLGGQEIHTEDVNAAVSRASERLISASMMSPHDLLVELDTSRAGLSEEAALERRARYGSNEIAHETMAPWYRQLIKAFINPFIGILIVLALTSFVTEVLFAAPGEEEISAVVIISILILVSVLLTFVQEYQANKAADQLLALIQTRATVQRVERGRHHIATRDLVPGDLVHLAAGDIIPADVYLLATNNLSVN